MNQKKTKVLLHLAVPLKPLEYGTQLRMRGILKYFNDRKDFISVDAVAGNQYRETWPTLRWNSEQTREALKFVNRVFVYEGKDNLYDRLYARIKNLYYNKILREEIPVDSDCYTPPGYIEFVHKLIDRNDYNFVWINTLNFAHLAANLRSAAAIPHTIIDTHDLCCRLCLMTKENTPCNGLKFDYELNFMKEVNLLNRFDTVISDSNYELSLLLPHLSSQKLESIPHLVDGLGFNSEEFSYKTRKFKHDLLFVGHNTLPNRDGVQFFLNSIFPIIVQAKPDTQLTVAGNVCESIHVSSKLSQNVKLLGYVPDLSELHLQSRLVICPLINGAGTKTKLVEAMSYALPIVTTQTCASALFLEDGVNALIADEPIQFANYALSILMDTQFAETLSQAVKATFEQHYSAVVIYAKLDAMFGIKHLLES